MLTLRFRDEWGMSFTEAHKTLPAWEFDTLVEAARVRHQHQASEQMRGD